MAKKLVTLDRLATFLDQVKGLIPRSKSDMGLGNVDNTADSSKSVASAATLTTARTIGITEGAIGTGTSFDGTKNIAIPITSMKEAYLDWGGKNLSGTVSLIDAAMCEEMSANRLSFMSPDGITVEYSTDGGSTWVDYGATDAQKTNLVTNTNSTAYFYFGHGADVSIDNQLRITISAKAADIYFQAKKALIYLANGGATMQVDVERSLIGSPTTFSTVSSGVDISGNSGWNSIVLGSWAFGGADTQTSNTYAVRFTFYLTAVKTSKSIIKRIFMFGPTMWSSSHSMQISSRAYAVDSDKTAIFAGDVQAPTFKGTLEGNAASATSATKAIQDSAGQQIDSTYIKGLSVSGQTITYTMGDGSTGAITTQDTDTTYEDATETASGLMSAADKTKLDGLPEGGSAYVLPEATASTLGGVKVGDNIEVATDGTISLTKDNVTAALGYTPPESSASYSTGTATEAGITKLYTETGSNTDGAMTQAAVTELVGDIESLLAAI